MKMRVTLLVAVALTQASAERPHEEEESFTMNCDGAAAIRAAAVTLEGTCQANNAGSPCHPHPVTLALSPCLAPSQHPLTRTLSQSQPHTPSRPPSHHPSPSPNPHPRILTRSRSVRRPSTSSKRITTTAPMTPSRATRRCSSVTGRASAPTSRSSHRRAYIGTAYCPSACCCSHAGASPASEL